MGEIVKGNGKLRRRWALKIAHPREIQIGSEWVKRASCLTNRGRDSAVCAHFVYFTYGR